MDFTSKLSIANPLETFMDDQQLISDFFSDGTFEIFGSTFELDDSCNLTGVIGNPNQNTFHILYYSSIYGKKELFCKAFCSWPL
jgi:hypothetical protein